MLARRAAAALGVMVAVAWGVAPSATAEGGASIRCPTGWVLNTGYAACTLVATSGGGTGGGDPGGGGGDGDPVCMYGNKPITCTHGGGYWVASRQCWVSKITNPRDDDPAWEGHDPDGPGALYNCVPPTGWETHFWSLMPPPPTEGVVPMDLLGQVMDRMALRGIEMGSTPPMIPGRVGLVGFPVWLWAQNPDAHTWGPTSASASASGYSMSATARASRVEWEMGNGDVVACNGPGVAWNEGAGREPSPECGYRYERDGRYGVQAVTFWEVQWAGLGQSGTIPLALFARGDLVVGEAQVLVERR